MSSPLIFLIILIRNEAADIRISPNKRVLHVTYLGKLNKEYPRSEKINFFKGSSGYPGEFEDLLNLYSRDLSILEVLPTVKDQLQINPVFKVYNKYDGERVAKNVLTVFFQLEEKLKNLYGYCYLRMFDYIRTQNISDETIIELVKSKDPADQKTGVYFARANYKDKKYIEFLQKNKEYFHQEILKNARLIEWEKVAKTREDKRKKKEKNK